MSGFVYKDTINSASYQNKAVLKDSPWCGGTDGYLQLAVLSTIATPSPSFPSRGDFKDQVWPAETDAPKTSNTSRSGKYIDFKQDIYCEKPSDTRECEVELKLFYNFYKITYLGLNQLDACVCSDNYNKAVFKNLLIIREMQSFW